MGGMLYGLPITLPCLNLFAKEREWENLADEKLIDTTELPAFQIVYCDTSFNRQEEKECECGRPFGIPIHCVQSI